MNRFRGKPWKIPMIDRRYLEHVDWWLVAVTFFISFLGCLTIYSVTFQDPGFSDYKKQVLWIGIGALILILTNMFNYRVWIKLAPIIYFLAVIGLFYLLIFGKKELGVRRWVFLPGGIRIQPSEFAKLALILMLSRWLTRWQGLEPKLGHLIMPSLLTGLPLSLILLEPDLGTSLMVIPLYIFMIFVSGFDYRKMIVLGILLATLAVFVAPHILKPYQVERITSFINPENDPLGAGYHLLQSKIAIGSGGMLGKGYKEGTQSHLNFLPVQDTDFIFAVWAEERGFVGVAILLGLFLFMIIRCLRIARIARDFQGAYLCTGFTAILFSQIIVNTGMVSGLMPITGLPLPFMSYGGSSCISNFFAIGIILNICIRRFEDYKL
jgi:rod shape determining protein RodA